MRDDKTRYEVYYPEFEYKGHKDSYFYEIPFDTFIEGVREWFDRQMINIDGKDNDIWNTLVEFGVFDAVESDMEEWFKDKCKEDAFEEFKERVEEDIELDREEAEYQARKNAEYDDID